MTTVGAPVGPRWWRRLVAVVSGFVLLVVVDPVRDGRLRTRGWPPGLAAVSALALLGYLATGALVLLARPLRDRSVLVSDPAGLLVLPEVALAPLLLVVVLALTLLFAGALHLPRVLVVLAWCLSAVPVLITTGVTTTVLGPAALLPGLLALIGLAVLAAVRRRRPFHWAEPVWTAGLLALGLLGPMALQQQGLRELGQDLRVTQLNLLFTAISYVAIPAVVIGGAALAEIAVRAGAWGVAVVREHTPRRWWPLPSALLVLGVTVWSVWLLVRQPVGVAVSSLPLLLGVVALVAVGALRRRGDPVGPEDVLQEWPALLTPLAFATVAAGQLVVPVLLAQSLGLTGPGTEAPGVAPGRAALAILAVVLAVAWYADGQRVRPVLLLAFAATVGSGLLLGLGPRDAGLVWTPDGLAAAVCLLCVALLGGFALTRRLTGRRATALVLAIALSGCFLGRGVVADPISWLLGFSAVAVALFGLVWRLLSDATWTRGDSPSFPGPSRVLLFWGYALLAVTAVAFVALGRQLGGQADVTPFTELGDHLFGTPVYLAAVLGCLWQCVHRGRAVVPDVAEELAD